MPAMTTTAAPPVPTLETALRVAREALAPHADPTAADAGVPALVHGALTLIEAAQRAQSEAAYPEASHPDAPAAPPAGASRRRGSHAA